MDSLEKRLQLAQWMAEDFACIISEEHKRMLDAWRAEHAGNDKEYQELLMEVTKRQDLPSEQREEIRVQWEKFVSRYPRKKLIYRRFLLYAAVLMLFLAVALVFQWKQQDALLHTSGNIRLAEGKICLILSDGKKVTIGEKEQQLLKEGSVARIEVDERTIRYTGKDTVAMEESFNTLIIPKGGEYRIVLSDSTVVWLNAETEFRYPVHFTSEQRKVYLKGEAYFEVVRNAEKPFIVHTPGYMEVKVLGTRFNVSSYEDDAEVVTTLMEGRVEISTGEEAIRIRPDEQVVFNKIGKTLVRREVDAGIYAAWKDDQFVFEEQPLEEIMKQLQRWYEMDVFFAKEEAKNYRFSGNLQKYENFDRIVKMLEEVAGVKIGIQGKCVVIGAK